MPYAQSQSCIAAFWVWSALYFSLPFIVPVLWYRNTRRSDPIPLTDHEVISPLIVSRAYASGGIGLIVLVFALFFFPGTMADVWPWEISSLTARVLAAQLLLIGSYFVVISRQTRWEIGRTHLRPFLLLPLLYVVAVASSWDDIEASKMSTWIYLSCAAFLLMLYVPGFYTYMELRRRSAISQAG